MKASASVPLALAPAAMAALALVMATICQAVEHTINLPEDVDVLTMHGKGFNLQLTQLANIKEKWQELTDEASKVETPRALDEDSARVNVNMFEQIIAEQQRTIEELRAGSPTASAASSGLSKSPSRFLGSLNSYSRPDFDGTRKISTQLYDWIQRRAEAIARKYESYANELDSAKLEPARAIVIHILLLNTYVDMQNIVKEKFDSSFKTAVWIRKKMDSLKTNYSRSMAAIESWLKQLFVAVNRVESKQRDVNYEWMANMRDIKRFLHEQKFSEELAQQCWDFLGHEWMGLSRNRRLELNKDYLSHDRALGRLHKAFGGQVAFQLPFAVQDSILRGY